MSVFEEKCCSICMEETKKTDFITVIMPCMHTMCTSCMDNMLIHRMYRCHICRGEIEDVLETMGGEEEEVVHLGAPIVVSHDNVPIMIDLT